MKSTILKLKKGADIQLTKNFNSSELDCKCSYKSCTHTLIDLEHLVELQKFRDESGPIKITSAYRCERHNKAVGGSTKSRHLVGVATDIQVSNMSPKEVADSLDYLNGVGVYNTFVHIDSRELEVGQNVARWDNRTKK